MNWGVDGKLLRVWITISIPSTASTDGKGNYEGCAVPTKQTNPLYDPSSYFSADGGNILVECRDILAWASTIGHLAKQFPQIVGFGIDDLSDKLDATAGFDSTSEFQSRLLFNQSCIAQIEIQAAVRSSLAELCPDRILQLLSGPLDRQEKLGDLVPTIELIYILLPK